VRARIKGWHSLESLRLTEREVCSQREKQQRQEIGACPTPGVELDEKTGIALDEETETGGK
jgi:hypothetical protein